VSAVRFPENPSLTLKSSPTIGDNSNGPSVIKVPDWVPNKLGAFYMYFAHHRGMYIRLAYATDRNYKQPHSSITSTMPHWDRYVVEPPATTERIKEAISISLTRISRSENKFLGRRFPRGRSEFFKCAFKYRTCNRRSSAGKAHAFENFPCIEGWMDHSKNFQTTVALGAF
jgi:hypothetical protein